MSYFDRNPVGRLVTRMTTDVDVLQEMFSSGVMTLISDFVMVFWIIGIMFLSSRRVGFGFPGADPADGRGDQFLSGQGAPRPIAKSANGSRGSTPILRRRFQAWG